VKNVIIGIHGLGNKPDRALLTEWWRAAIDEGLERIGQPIPAFEFELVYWADLLHPIPKSLDVADPEDPLHLTHPYVPASQLFDRQPHRFRRRMLRTFENLMDRLLLNDDMTLNYEHIADSLIHYYFQDLEAYYASPAEGVVEGKPSFRMLVRERLAATLRKHQQDRILLIAHSMGSIIAFDVLDLNPDLKVETFVTIGSPLGLPVVMARIASERVRPGTPPGALTTPPNIIAAWHNFADLEDKVAVNFDLSDDYHVSANGVKPVDHEIVNDYEFEGERNPHKIYGYLRAPELSGLLAPFLTHPLPGWWERQVRSFSTWWRKWLGRAAAPHEPGPILLLPEDSSQGCVQRFEGPDCHRDRMLEKLTSRTEPWDFVVIGGGATGLGVAVEAASRGYQVLLLEQHDFGKGTSSRSTKLVHGGVRYLQQGNVSLVLEALRERAVMRDNAPHLVHDLPFIVPVYDWWEGPFYGIGLRLYDLLAGRHGFGSSRNLTREETIERIPVIETDGLRGGVVYHDGQFDDARFIVNLVQTAAEEGAVLLNYAQVTRLVQEDGLVRGLKFVDSESGRTHEISTRCVINATGVFADDILRMNSAEWEPIVQPSRGIHIVLDRSFLGGDTAIMVPHTDDGRVLFAIPWYDRVLFGTTDTPVDKPSLEPTASREELEFLLEHAARYLVRDPKEGDVLSVFAGLRPLVKNGAGGATSSISRDHTILISRSGLVTVTGGKWTTYRHMAEETVDQAISVAQLTHVPSLSRDLPLHGWHEHAHSYGDLACYGSDAAPLQAWMKQHPESAEPLHPRLPVNGAQVVWAARHEMARTVEDVLSRRTRSLLFDARAAVKVSPRVASLLGRELGKGRSWEHEQVEEFTELARLYLPEGIVQ